MAPPFISAAQVHLNLSSIQNATARDTPGYTTQSDNIEGGPRLGRSPQTSSKVASTLNTDLALRLYLSLDQINSESTDSSLHFTPAWVDGSTWIRLYEVPPLLEAREQRYASHRRPSVAVVGLFSCTGICIFLRRTLNIICI